MSNLSDLANVCLRMQVAAHDCFTAAAAPWPEDGGGSTRRNDQRLDDIINYKYLYINTFSIALYFVDAIILI